MIKIIRQKFANVNKDLDLTENNEFFKTTKRILSHPEFYNDSLWAALIDAFETTVELLHGPNHQDLHSSGWSKVCNTVALRLLSRVFVRTAVSVYLTDLFVCLCVKLPNFMGVALIIRVLLT